MNELKKILKDKKISQAKLALSLNISRQAVNYWVKHHNGMTQKNLERVCELLDVTPNKLLGKEKSRFNLLSPLFEIIKR